MTLLQCCSVAGPAALAAHGNAVLVLTTLQYFDIFHQTAQRCTIRYGKNTVHLVYAHTVTTMRKNYLSPEGQAGFFLFLCFAILLARHSADNGASDWK